MYLILVFNKIEDGKIVIALLLTNQTTSISNINTNNVSNGNGNGNGISNKFLIEFNSFLSQSFHIYFSNKSNSIFLSRDKKKLTLRYHCSKLSSIVNNTKDKIINSAGFFFNNIISSSQDNTILSLQCGFCNANLLYNNCNSKGFSNVDDNCVDKSKDLFVFNDFNFNYNESMDMLTCHESHDQMEIDIDRLLRIVSIGSFKVSINSGFICHNKKNTTSISSSISNEPLYNCYGCGTTLGKDCVYNINNSFHKFTELDVLLLNVNNNSDNFRETKLLDFILDYIIYEEKEHCSLILANKTIFNDTNTDINNTYLHIKLTKRNYFISNSKIDLTIRTKTSINTYNHDRKSKSIPVSNKTIFTLPSYQEYFIFEFSIETNPVVMNVINSLNCLNSYNSTYISNSNLNSFTKIVKLLDKDFKSLVKAMIELSSDSKNIIKRVIDMKIGKNQEYSDNIVNPLNYFAYKVKN